MTELRISRMDEELGFLWVSVGWTGRWTGPARCTATMEGLRVLGSLERQRRWLVFSSVVFGRVPRLRLRWELWRHLLLTSRGWVPESALL